MRKALIASLIFSFLSSSASGAWYEKATDNFNRANANPIGSPWATMYGNLPMTVTDNMARLSSANNLNGSIYTGVTFGGNQYSQAYIAGNPVESYHRVSVREQTGAHSGYNFTFGVTDVYLYRCTNGDCLTTLASGTTASKTAGDLYRIEVSDNVITCYRNGTQVLTATDNTYTSGYPSIEQYNQSLSGLDNWSGGDDIPPAGSGTGGRSRRTIFLQ